jgi:peptidoglycan/xylan/chitin deacetylase (PgdA/CDA1 family)
VWLLIVVNLAGKIAAGCVFLAAPAAALGLWFLPDALLAYHLFLPHSQGLVRNYRRFTTTDREVWLTIDDGPDPADTPAILALLATHHARATFFVIGKNAAAHPELLRAIVAAGHEVAHHTYTHPSGSFWCASQRRLAQELNAGLTVLLENGISPTRFRPPVGIKNLWLAGALARCNLVCVGWSARGLERRRGNPQDVAARVLADLTPGAILLLHEGPRVPAAIRVEAIRYTLEALDAKGYRCVIPKTELLKTAWDN